MSKNSKGLLFLGFYPIDELNSAPKIRIYNMNKQLNAEFSIIGFSFKRFKEYIKLFFYKKINKIKYVYIEPNASTANFIDLFFLTFLRLKKVKISIFIRDVYPLYIYYWKKLKWYQTPHYLMWFLSIFVYFRIAVVRFYPSDGYSKALKDKKRFLLPPGCNLNSDTIFNKHSKIILYSGNLNPAFGELLIKELARKIKKSNSDLKIGIIFKGDIDHLTEIGLPIIKLGNCLSEYKGDALLGIIPRQITKYFNMSFPLKIMDYIQLGLPIITTNCSEISHFVDENKIGYHLSDDSDKWLEKINMLAKDKKKSFEIHEQVLLTKKRNSWNDRAKLVLNTLMEV